MSNWNSRIVTSTDDAYKVSGGSFFNALSAIGQGTAIACFRFQNVTIPHGAIIDSATLTLKNDGVGDSANISSIIRGIAEDNTSTFSSDPTGRSTTSAGVTFTKNGVSINEVVTTPDIASVIQEITDRAGWASGNAMGFLFLNNGSSVNRFWISYDSSPSVSALLDINYHVVGSPNITKSLRFVVAHIPNRIEKLLRYSIADLEAAPVPFIGMKVAKAGHNVLNTKKPDNLTYSSDYQTLKYFMNGHKALNVSQPIGTQYRVIDSVDHNLGYFPFAIVYAKDNIMSNYQPLGHYQAGAGAYRQFYYYVTTSKLFVVATGFTGLSGGDSYTVDYYYKIFSNRLGL